MMVTPYMHHDLSGLLENPDVTLSEPQIKCYMLQLLQGTKYLHQVTHHLGVLLLTANLQRHPEPYITSRYQRYLHFYLYKRNLLIVF